MTSLGWLYGTALWLCLTPVAASAQASEVLLTEGVRAYRDLEFAAAAQLLRRALEPAGGLSPADRLQALMYLGAAQIFGEERDQSVAAFRNLVLADPRYRPDSLVFPPRVTGIFYEVLQTTKAIAVVAPRETRLPLGDGRFTVRAYATSRHFMEARITSAKSGDTVATLHRGEVTDSAVIAWNGLDSAGGVVSAGQYTLVVTSSLTPDQVLRSVHLPLLITQQAVDTLPWPPPPARTGGRWDLRVLVPSAVVGAGLIVPAALGAGGAEGLRITLGIAVGAAGVVGGHRRASGPSAESEATWRARVASAQEENRRRRSAPALIIRTGAPELREGTME